MNHPDERKSSDQTIQSLAGIIKASIIHEDELNVVLDFCPTQIFTENIPKLAAKGWSQASIVVDGNHE